MLQNVLEMVSWRIELNAKPGRKPVISNEMENVLARKVVEAANKGFRDHEKTTANENFRIMQSSKD